MGERHDPREATIVVAASGSDTLSADYRCSGAADDVEINAALADAGVDGKVVLLDGTYVLADPIILTHNNQALEGQGRGTLIDGDGLATGEHAIQIDNKTNCTVRNLAVQTAEGGANTIHCIFINDGANYTTIDNVTIVDSESDGIHIEGTATNDVIIKNCHIIDADDHGIYVDMDTDNNLILTRIQNCMIVGTGNEGIQFDSPGGTGHNNWLQIHGNVIYAAGEDGIDIHSSDGSSIEGNLVLDCTTNGILLTNCDECVISNNVAWSCAYSGIYIGGTSVNNAITSNVCTDNGADGEYAGIHTGTVSYMNIVGNLCYNNRKYGIAFGVAGGGYNNVTGNICRGNYEDGLVGGGADTLIEGNICWDNSTGSAGADHGIRLTNNCARCSVIGNWCGDDGGNVQEDGIHLESGAVSVLIRGNYLFNNMGAGIALAANNTDCVIDGNFCNENDDSGIEVLLGCSRSSISGNSCLSNLLHGITCSSPQCKINDNLLVGNGTASAGTYHGIYLANTAADRCSICNNVIHDAGAITEDGIHLVDGVEGCQINGNYIYNTMGDGIMLTDNNHYCQVSNNHIEDVDDRGIHLTGSDYCAVNGNLIDSPGNSGISVHTSSRYCAINDNHIRSTGAYGIEVNGSCIHCCAIGNHVTASASAAGIMFTGASHFGTASGNHIDGSQYGIYCESSNDCVVTGNTIALCVEDGIVLDNASDCVVSGNVSTDNDTGASGCSGITVWDSHHNVISGNKCNANGLHGIYVYRGDYNTISGNSCSNQDTGDGIHIFGDGGRNSDYNTIVGNTCTGNADDGVAIEGTTDANKNIVVANNLYGNSGTNLVDNGTDTQIGHNVTA